MSKSSPDGSSLIPYEITTSPPLKFRAVHKETKGEYFLGLDDVRYGVLQLEKKAVALKDCDIDQSTGHHDADSKEIYGGDVVVIQSTPECSLSPLHTGKELIFIVAWNKESLLWDLKDATGGYGFFEFWDDQLSSMRVVGNIHNPDALPEEVRRMLCKK
jgi:uncharacterized phage protein (TIGR01671 family)